MENGNVAVAVDFLICNKKKKVKPKRTKNSEKPQSMKSVNIYIIYNNNTVGI